MQWRFSTLRVSTTLIIYEWTSSKEAWALSEASYGNLEPDPFGQDLYKLLLVALNHLGLFHEYSSKVRMIRIYCALGRLFASCTHLH